MLNSELRSYGVIFSPKEEDIRIFCKDDRLVLIETLDVRAVAVALLLTHL